jgi:DivIVA domain-containing protein
VSLDRDRIQRTDFPTRLRGYDRAAVDAHLRALADELEARAGSMAGAAGEQVRAVLAAAESSASEIRARAQHEAQALHAQATAALASAQGLASREQRDRADLVVASSGATLQRLDALRGELAALLDALGQSAPAAPATPAAAAERVAANPVGEAVTEPAEPHVTTADDRRQLVPDPDAPGAFPEPAGRDDLVPDPDAPSPPGADKEAEAGARLVALDLALGGTPREQADRYLAEHFGAGDRAALLDEVYAAAAR